MDALESLGKKDIKELLSKGWITHDAMWFMHALKEVGIEKTNRINRAAVQSMSLIEAERLKKALGFQNRSISTFDALIDFLSRAMDLVLARFMHFTVSSPRKNVIRWEMENEACFAYKGVSGMGVINHYECGVLYRIESWFQALGIDYDMKPRVTTCIMHETGECKGEFTFQLP